MEFTWTATTERTLSAGSGRLDVLEHSAAPLAGPLPGFPQVLARPARWRQRAVHVAGGTVTLEFGALQSPRGDLELQAVSAAGDGAAWAAFCAARSLPTRRARVCTRRRSGAPA